MLLLLLHRSFAITFIILLLGGCRIFMSGNYSFSEVDYPALFFAEFLFQLSTKC